MDKELKDALLRYLVVMGALIGLVLLLGIADVRIEIPVLRP